MNADLPPPAIIKPATEIRQIPCDNRGIPTNEPIPQAESTGVYIVTGTAIASGTSGSTVASQNLYTYSIQLDGPNLQDEVNLQLWAKKLAAAAELGTNIE